MFRSFALYGSETWTLREFEREFQTLVLEENKVHKMVR